MTEHDWLTSTDPQTMLAWTRGAIRGNTTPSALPDGYRALSDRKLRLFACACGVAAGKAAQDMEHVAKTMDASKWATSWANSVPNTISSVTPQRMKADILRDIVGNPWQSILSADAWERAVKTAAVLAGIPEVAGHFPPGDAPVELPRHVHREWLTPTVLSIADAIYAERTYSECPVLADALEEAGCNEEPLLRHLRGYEPCRINYGKGFHMTPRDTSIAPWKCDECHGEEWMPLRGGHIRGCWALDLILGKE